MKKLLIIPLLFIGFEMLAQPAPPSSHNPAPLPGLVYLAAGGAVLVYRQLKNKPGSDN